MPGMHLDLRETLSQVEQRLQALRALYLIEGERPGFHAMFPTPARMGGVAEQQRRALLRADQEGRAAGSVARNVKRPE